jgi:hypothetical protein
MGGSARVVVVALVGETDHGKGGVGNYLQRRQLFKVQSKSGLLCQSEACTGVACWRECERRSTAIGARRY